MAPARRLEGYLRLARSVGALVPALALLGACGGSSSNPGGSAPSSAPGRSTAAGAGWRARLGRGVVVTTPGSVASGHGSPAAALLGEAYAFDHRAKATACSYLEPAVQAPCRSALAGEPSSVFPTFENLAVTYVAVHGDEALVGATGSVCTPGQTPACSTNSDPSAIFSTGRPFPVLYAQAVAAGRSSSNSYSLAPCVRVGGAWYVYVPVDTF